MNVIQLADYRARREARRPVSRHTGPEYFCLACDADAFKLAQVGTVHCASCGALMRNLVITGSEP